MVQVYRKQAIRTAIKLASKGDIILVAGKGHEDYQEIGRKRYTFNDKEQAKIALEEWSQKHHGSA